MSAHMPMLVSIPPAWAWGTEGVHGQHRHYQEIIDALGRSLSLVSAPEPAHHAWLGVGLITSGMILVGLN